MILSTSTDKIIKILPAKENYRFTSLRVVSKAALTKARLNLKFEAFIDLNLYMIHYFEEHFKPRTWFGFRLLATDDSTTRLPMEEDIAKHFGV